jgi:hypothetical protein
MRGESLILQTDANKSYKVVPITLFFQLRKFVHTNTMAVTNVMRMSDSWILTQRVGYMNVH